ncbi:hypothetical protein P3W24_17580 [Luteibacter sp. PPL201]|uniref:Restriction endonuclease type IV Mrr domain-containing protein n=1 Tax=Luteibacter sahnii TaxID=3021977 RepID=A0ABT6BFL8_9GAMM
MKVTIIEKGYAMEELLRSYFLELGFYVARGVPFVFDGFDVTDVDLWLYERRSVASCQRAIVDIKNRKTPQAIERIFWTKGLQGALGLDQAIVATTDRRPSVTAFGRLHGVRVLDGDFLSRLDRSALSLSARLSEQEMLSLAGSFPSNQGSLGWRDRILRAKQLLITDLGFNAVNAWLSDGAFFVEQRLLVSTHRPVATRLFYLIISFIALGFDFVSQDLAFENPTKKFEALMNGLQFGSAGERQSGHVMGLALGLVEAYAPNGRLLAKRVRTSVERELASSGFSILAEYVSQPGAQSSLFAVAKDLEAFAYSASFTPPSELPVRCKSFLGMLLDFWEVDRRSFFDLPDAGVSGSNADQASQQELPLSPGSKK